MIMKEIWKDIPSFEGLYQASSLGRVRSLDSIRRYYNKRVGDYVNRRHKGGIIKPYLGNKSKYPAIKLGNFIKCELHIFIAWTFCKKPKGMNIVNHINYDKTDNRACNLEWTNISGNMKHSNHSSNFCKGEKHQNAKLSDGDVYDIKLWLAHRKELIEYAGNKRQCRQLTIKQIAEAYGVTRKAVCGINNGKVWEQVQIE